MRFTLALASVVPFFAVLGMQACGGDDTSNPATTDASTDHAQGTDTAVPDVQANDAPSGQDAPSEAGNDAGPTFSVVASFDPAKFQLAEGLITHKGNAYVGFAPLGVILEITPTGTSRTYATVPAGGNDGYTLGLVFDGTDNLYALQTKNTPDAGVNPGVYKIPPTIDGGAVTTPFASDPNMNFPNGLDLDAKGNLLVADSAGGVIFSVTPAGVVTTWKSDPELAGTPACAAPLPFPIGANGIAFTPSTVYVANTAKGSLLKIAVNADGSAGAVTPIVKDCKYVGFDGITLDTDGSILVVQNGIGGTLYRVTPTGTVTTLATGAPMDGPGSVTIATWNGAKSALVTNTAFFSVGIDGGSPKPALLRFAPLP
jgi:sugar lactone lactonase YvrE